MVIYLWINYKDMKKGSSQKCHNNWLVLPNSRINPEQICFIACKIWFNCPRMFTKFSPKISYIRDAPTSVGREKKLSKNVKNKTKKKI